MAKSFRDDAFAALLASFFREVPKENKEKALELAWEWANEAAWFRLLKLRKEYDTPNLSYRDLSY